VIYLCFNSMTEEDNCREEGKEVNPETAPGEENPA
jgi:hypothetical protein